MDEWDRAHSLLVKLEPNNSNLLVDVVLLRDQRGWQLSLYDQPHRVRVTREREREQLNLLSSSQAFRNVIEK